MTTTTHDTRLSPSDVNELLDDRGLHDASRGPGCYALELAVPDSVEAAHRQWLTVHDAVPEWLDRLATADRCAYVGAATSVYERLLDHVRADVRKVAVLEAFSPVDVIDVWPADSTGEAFDREYGRACDLSRQGWTVACNGVVVG